MISLTLGAVSELETFKRRAGEARRRLQALPAGTGADRQGPPDPQTGERWDRYNVLGHMAEFLPFWVAEVGAGVRGEEFGRRPGATERQQAVEGGRSAGEAALRDRVDAGVDALVAFLDTLSPAALGSTIAMRGRGEVEVRWALENLLVGHLEGHVKQLEELEPPA